MTKVKDVLQAMDTLTGGRVVQSLSDITTGNHPFVLMKTSNLPGKEIIETPGLIYGDPEKPVKKIAVTMTLTEGVIELAGASGVDAIVAHHPIAEAANSGGVPLKNYLDLYDLSVFELHESFHGLHPGIPFLHGHQVYRSEISYGGLHGNILFVGQALEEIHTLQDILQRLDQYMGLPAEEELLYAEKEIKQTPSTLETCLMTKGKIYVGNPSSPVGNILHIFPHTGFSPEHLRKAAEEHPEADTVLASISRVYEGHPLIETARELGLNFMVGNSHALEILENGLPLAYALESLLRETEVVVFRERITSTSLREMGSPNMQAYGQEMAAKYLVKKDALAKSSL